MKSKGSHYSVKLILAAVLTTCTGCAAMLQKLNSQPTQPKSPPAKPVVSAAVSTVPTAYKIYASATRKFDDEQALLDFLGAVKQAMPTNHSFLTM